VKESIDRSRVVDEEQAPLALILGALSHPIRRQVVAALHGGRRYVSALARDLQISRPLLYMHLERLERAGLVSGSLELGSDGRAVKWYELRPFDVRITAAAVVAAAAEDRTAGPSTEKKGA
jgi:DNA-binding transcriptional ArsR family regulator